MKKHFDKHKLVQSFISQLETELATLEASIKATREEATHEESKPENEYDTRALETGYLVKAQSKRILDAKEMLSALKHMNLKVFSDEMPIESSALIELQFQNKLHWFLYLPTGGGATLEFEGTKIQVLTPTSPLGEALLGLKVGDDALVENGNDVKEYEIISIQ